MRARWRILSKTIRASVESVEAITKAVICLHNYLRQTKTACYCPSGFVDSEDASGEVRPGEWRQIVTSDGSGALRDIPSPRGRRYPNAAGEVRQALTEYFMSDAGALPWQLDYV